MITGIRACGFCGEVMSYNSYPCSLVTSKLTSNLILKFGIDKLNFKFYKPIQIDELIAYWKSSNIDFEYTKEEDNKLSLKCNNFCFVYGHPKAEFFKEIRSNPSKFKCFQNYAETFNQVIPYHLQEDLYPNELDIFCDVLNQTFIWLNQRLYFKGKQHFERIVEKSIEERTRYFGKKPFLIRLYNKLLLLKKKRKSTLYPSLNPTSINRIEISLGKKYLKSFKTIAQIVAALKNKNFNPFNCVCLIDFKFTDLPSFDTITNQQAFEKLIRLIELKTLIENVGLHYAKKRLNKYKNFNRYYGEFLENINEISISQFYHQGIEEYFNSCAVPNCTEQF